jgi:hypothetical protein
MFNILWWLVGAAVAAMLGAAVEQVDFYQVL